jgi:hypothetical protein
MRRRFVAGKSSKPTPVRLSFNRMMTRPYRVHPLSPTDTDVVFVT